MNMVNPSLEETALSLDPQRRAQLAATLIKSLEPAEVDEVDAVQIEQLWFQEFEDRMARYRAGEVDSVSWDEVKKRLLSRNK